MQIYETSDDLPYSAVQKFTEWFEDTIGTEYEINENEIGQYYIMFYDLTYKEVESVRDFETNLEY